jgi:hypothetical protein
VAAVFTALQLTPTTAAHWSSSIVTTPRIAQILDTNGKTSLSLIATASAVNHLQFNNSAAGNGVQIIAAGTDTNVDLSVRSRGNGWVQALTGNAATIARFGGIASPVNYWSFNPSTAGNAIAVSALGTDTNISINLAPKGSGTVNVNSNPVGVKVAVPASAGATGAVGQWAADSSWIYVCTAANTWVRGALATW